VGAYDCRFRFEVFSGMFCKEYRPLLRLDLPTASESGGKKSLNPRRLRKAY